MDSFGFGRSAFADFLDLQVVAHQLGYQRMGLARIAKQVRKCAEVWGKTWDTVKAGAGRIACQLAIHGSGAHRQVSVSVAGESVGWGWQGCASAGLSERGCGAHRQAGVKVCGEVVGTGACRSGTM